MLNLVADKKKRRIVARVGSKPVVIPAGVDVSLALGNRMLVKGCPLYTSDAADE